MQYYWLRDRVTQEQFRVYWDKGINNWADYHTKHHPIIHHLKMRGHYVRDLVEKICTEVTSEGVLRHGLRHTISPAE